MNDYFEHFKPMETNIKCSECGKPCKNKAGLASHLRSHKTIDNNKSVNEEIAPKVERKERKKRISNNRAIKFCPCCGLNLEVLAVAVQMS